MKGRGRVCTLSDVWRAETRAKIPCNETLRHCHFPAVSFPWMICFGASKGQAGCECRRATTSRQTTAEFLTILPLLILGRLQDQFGCPPLSSTLEDVPVVPFYRSIFIFDLDPLPSESVQPSDASDVTHVSDPISASTVVPSSTQPHWEDPTRVEFDALAHGLSDCIVCRCQRPTPIQPPRQLRYGPTCLRRKCRGHDKEDVADSALQRSQPRPFRLAVARLQERCRCRCDAAVGAPCCFCFRCSVVNFDFAKKINSPDWAFRMKELCLEPVKAR